MATGTATLLTQVLVLPGRNRWPRSFPAHTSPHSRRIVLAQAGSQQGPDSAAESESDDEFEARLSKLQRKVTSGSGKKAEVRKARKEGGPAPASTAAAASKESVFLPPVPLQDPVSKGLPVQLGFNSYTERLNGKFAALGLAAVLLVELATGSSFIKFHDSSIIGLQVYTVLSAAALFIKFEKESSGVWPKA